MIPTKVKLGQYYNYSLGELFAIDFYLKNPNFQRPIVWTIEQKIKLIESLWLGIPIGTYSINILDDCEHEYHMLVIDGQKRIDAISEYRSGKFKVYDLLYSELSDCEKYRFKICKFPQYVTQSYDIEYLKNYYNLMNFGGTAHKEAERA